MLAVSTAITRYMIVATYKICVFNSQLIPSSIVDLNLDMFIDAYSLANRVLIFNRRASNGNQIPPISG